MKTTVINLRTTNVKNYIRIDRMTMLGNPFRIGRDGTRKQVITKHKRYMRSRMRTDRKFRWAVEALKGQYIGCWCAPLPCHGDNYVEYLEGKKK